MKSKFLNINKPCAEKWENMKPNEKGNFCNLCSKNVIDLTQLSQVEISNKIKKEKGNICARITQSQLNMPLFDFDTQKEYNLPFSNIAAGLMIATSLTACQTNHTEKSKIPTEFVQNTNAVLNPQKKISESKPTSSVSVNSSVLKGSIKDEAGVPVNNAKITLVTIKDFFTTYSLKDGSFSLEIPSELIDNDNVIRVSYNEIKKEREEHFWGYETNDYILSKEELNSNYNIEAIAVELILGGIGHYSVERNPIVINNGVEIKYKEFLKAQQGKKSSCSMENKDFYYFESNIAVAIYGKKALEGLYILTNKK